MKKILFGTLALVSLLGVTSCVKVNFDDEDTTVTPTNPTDNIISGTVSASRFYAKGKYVVVEDEDFAKASPEKSKTIDIVQFVKEEEIDPVFYEKPYYVLPDKKANKSYELLVKALEETETVGLAEFMLRTRMHICALKAYNGILLLHQMRYHEEVREVPEIEKPKGNRITTKEVVLAVKLVHQQTEKIKTKAYKDTYVAALKKLIKAKATGIYIRIAEPKETTATVKDLMEVLKQSLEGKKKKRA